MLEQNLVEIWAVMHVVFYRRLGHKAVMWKHDVSHKTGST